MKKIISALILAIMFLAAFAISAFALPSITITAPSTAFEGQEFTISYTAHGNGERLMQIKVKDLAESTEIVHGGLFAYEYSEFEKYTKSIGTYSFQLEALDEKGASYTDLVTITVVGDTFAPGTVQNLHAVSKTNESIKWAWTNPSDADFKEAIVFFDDINVLNTTGTEYTATGLTELTNHNISMQTADNLGNINTTIVQDMQQTMPNLDLVAPAPVSSIASVVRTNETISWEWVNPLDLDLNHIAVYIDNAWKQNITTYYYNATGFSAGTSHKIGLVAVDNSGNMAVLVENTALTLANPDTTAAAAVSGLSATLVLMDRITWSWTNPADADFNHTVIFIDNVNVANSTGTAYTAAGFTGNTQHKIGMQTVDNAGNTNTNTVENTATTLASTTPGFTVSDVQFTGKASSTLTAVMTMTNTGTQDLSAVEVVKDILAKYSATVSNVGPIAVGASRSINITIAVPSNETIGTKDIGKLNVTSAGVFKQANARLVVEGSLEIDNVDITGVTGVSSKKSIQDEANFTLNVKPESSFKVDVTLKNGNGDGDIKDIIVKGVLNSINNGKDIEVSSDKFTLKAGKDSKVSLKFDLPLALNKDDEYILEITAEGKDANGNSNDASYDFKVAVEKASNDIRVKSATFSRNNAACLDSTVLTVKAINAGTKKQDNIVIEARNFMLGLASQKTVSFTDDENYEQVVEFPITLPESEKNKAGTYNIAIKIMKDSTFYDAEEAVLTVQECRTAAPAVTQEEPKEDVTVQFVSANSEPGSNGMTFENKKTGIGKTLSDAMSGLNLGNDTLVIGGISFAVLLIAGIIGLIIYKRSTEILF